MMNSKNIFATVLFLLTTLSAFVSAEENSHALAEFERGIEMRRYIMEQVQAGNMTLPFKVQQYDKDATEVKLFENSAEYQSAIADQFYGYQVFILIDKSYSAKPSKRRFGNVRTPQTMYIYVRDGDQLRLAQVHPISTGKELKPGKVDTREGFLRVQSAQAKYKSRKFGEAMPFSLWFESEYGTAIHQTLQIRCDRSIGKRASAGCVRLCPIEAEQVFRLVTNPKFKKTTPIVLLDKRTGIPVAKGLNSQMSRDEEAEENYASLPKVIRGLPVFVRIIDGNSIEKVIEINKIIENPSKGFQNYFKPFTADVHSQLAT